MRAAYAGGCPPEEASVCSAVTSGSTVGATSVGVMSADPFADAGGGSVGGPGEGPGLGTGDGSGEGGVGVGGDGLGAGGSNGGGLGAGGGLGVGGLGSTSITSRISLCTLWDQRLTSAMALPI